MKEYIERGELKRILKKRYYELAGMRPDFYAGYMTAFHIIEDDIPNAADVVEVRHAKWDDYYKCTACGNEALLEEKPDTMAHGLNSLFFVDSDYCPNCGAKMDKEE